MLHFHIEILTGAEGIIFGGDVVVGDDDGEILDGVFSVKGADDLVLFGGGEEGLLVFAVLDLGAEFGGVHKDDGA